METVRTASVRRRRGFSATATNSNIVPAAMTRLHGRFYGPAASEIAGTFTISRPNLLSPAAGLTLIGSFGAK